MDGKHLLLFILFQGIVNTEALTNDEEATSRSAYFETEENKRLKGHVFERFESPDLLSYSRSCMRNNWCSSTNFKVSANNDDKGTCELNEHVFIDGNTEFDEEEGVMFSMLLKVIYFWPMFNNYLQQVVYHKNFVGVYFYVF